MSFISIAFALLYGAALLLRLARARRDAVFSGALLVLSWTFYAWHEPRYLLLILASTLVDYAAGRWLSSHGDAGPGLRRTVLIASLSVNLGLLACFKYLDFAVRFLQQTLAALGAGHGAELSLPEILLPIGISFYTFQSISYTVDIYRGKLEAERDFLAFALYISFFPQLVAGPIVRARQFLYQLRRPRRVRVRVWLEGGYLLLRGLFLKVVVADNLGTIVDRHWSAASEPGAPAWLAWAMMALFAGQLFADFSGYSDMARGLAYPLGIRLPVNFNAPFLATSFRSFWRRWHITLSTWMRDYLYIPLGGDRRTRLRTLFNIWIVMVLSGLWHGAEWTFVLWGAMHGALAVAERTLSAILPARGIGRAGSALVGFFVVQASWILSMALFRSGSLDEAGQMLDNALLGLFRPTALAVSADGLALACWLIAPVWAMHVRQHLTERWGWPCPGIHERAVYAGAMLAAIMTLYSEGQPFIYFQF